MTPTYQDYVERAADRATRETTLEALARLLDDRITMLDRVTSDRESFVFRCSVLNGCRGKEPPELLAMLIEAYRTKLNAACDAHYSPKFFEIFQRERARVTELQWLLDTWMKEWVVA